MSSNPFTALASPAPQQSTINIAPLFGVSSSIAGTKHPRSPTQSLPTPAPPVPLAKPVAPNPRLQDLDFSVFDVLNIFQSRWFINCKHLIANVLLATKDADGRFTWVDFLPVFHTSLIKQMCTLLPPMFTVAHSKWVLFVFLLEILTGDEGPKPEVFWRARKKHSRASREVCLATSQAPNPVPRPPSPSPVPAMSPEPSAPATSQAAPFPFSLTRPRSNTPDDVEMAPCVSSPPTATDLTLGMKKWHLQNSAFLKSFPKNLDDIDTVHAWCFEAH